MLSIMSAYDIYHLFVLRTPEDYMTNKSIVSMCIYLVPITLIFGLPNTSNDIKLENKVLDLATVNEESLVSVNIIEEQSTNSIEPDETEETSDTEVNDNLDLAKSDNNDNRMPIERFTKDDFYNTYLTLFNDMGRILNTEITLDGFVYVDEYTTSTQFVISRYLMSCCAADSSIIGVLVETEEDFVVDSWVKVTGVVTLEDVYFEATDSYEQTFILRNPVIETIEPYETPYVFYEAP
jgi:putative membrane protein